MHGRQGRFQVDFSKRGLARFMRKYFGTDGIRGRTNTAPMTPEIAMKVGQAAGAHFLRGTHKHRVVIGKDTRLSGYMMENALVAGFTSVGMNVVQFGPIPTPAVALLTRSMRADLGVMISASHNPFEDNGIKLFGPDGFKLSDADELAIEAALQTDIPLAEPNEIGRARRIEDAIGRYNFAVKASLPEHIRTSHWIAPMARRIRSHRRRYGNWGRRCPPLA
jgi:phosphoglucosamine mutase